MELGALRRERDNLTFINPYENTAVATLKGDRG
ncbi:MAG: hypothetical protein HW381_2115, partial [Candidatus Rokubacteria bacterium]|nr:hypothetical protein [Candidatus Rokubacteria bacterium]